MGIVYGRMNLGNSRVPSIDHTSCSPSKAKPSARMGPASGSSNDRSADDTSSSDNASNFRRETRQSSREAAARDAPVVLRRSARLRSGSEVRSTASSRSAKKQSGRLRRSTRIALIGATVSTTGGNRVAGITTRSRSSLLNHSQSAASSSLSLRRSLRRRSS